MPSDAVVKSVSKKLKYYFQVKRLEDGFDLSGPDCPRLDHPPTKARSTLQYDGLHDRPLKHYFSPTEVRTLLTQFKVPEEGAGQEKKVKKKVKKYIHNYDFKDPAPPKHDKPSALSEDYYTRTKRTGRHTRHDLMGYGVPLQKQKRPHTSYPVLRSTPNSYLTRGEANRLVNMATKLIVATDTVELKTDEERRQEKNPYMHRSQSNSLPSLNRSNSKPKSPRQQTCPRSFESPRRSKTSYDINGRKVSAQKRSSEEDDKGYVSSGHDGYVTISGRPADDEKVPRWLKKEMRHSKVKSKDGGQRPHSAAAPKSHSQRPPSGQRPKSAAVAQPRKPKVHKPADPSTLPIDVQPTAWDLEVCSTCADEETQQNAAPQARPVSAQTGGELLKDYDPMERVIWDGEMCRYRVHVITGDRLGASTKAEVKLVLCGDKGRTEEIWLKDSKKYKVPFQKGQEDVFDLEHFYVGKMRKISIGHDRNELGYGWFLERVVIKDMIRLVRYEIPCARWLSSKEGDGLTVRDFTVAQSSVFKEEEVESEPEPQEERKAATPETITYTTKAPSVSSGGSHTSLDMNRSRQGEQDTGSTRSRTRTLSGHSSSTYSSTATSPYHTDTDDSSTARSRSSDHSSIREPERARTSTQNDTPQVYVPNRRHRDDFFDQEVVSDKDYTSVIESMADREKDFPPTVKEQSGPNSGQITLKPVPRSTEPHVTFTQDTQGQSTSTTPSKTMPLYNDGDSDSETARLSLGDQSDRDEPEHQYLDGFKAGLEAAKKDTPRSPTHSDSSSDDSVSTGMSVHEASKVGDLERIKRLAKHNPGVKTMRDERSWCPLHISAKHGQLEVVQWLSVNLTDLDVLTPTGYTAIHIAAMNGHTDVIKVLSAMGAQLDCRNTDQQTPLHLAAMSGYLETVTWLVANNADLAARDNAGNTPLDRARMYEQSGVVQYLETCDAELVNPKSTLSMNHSVISEHSRSSYRSSRTSESSGSSTSGSDSETSATPRLHTHAHSSSTDVGRPKTSHGSRGGRSRGVDQSPDRVSAHDEELMTDANSGPSLLDKIRADYEKS